MNHTLLLNCSAEGMLQHIEGPGIKSGDELDIAKRTEDFQVQNVEVENHLEAAEGHSAGPLSTEDAMLKSHTKHRGRCRPLVDRRRHIKFVK